MSKVYQFFCERCGYKRVTGGTDVGDLVRVVDAPIPGGAPYRDPATGKVVTPKAAERPKRFKCPGCGFVIKAQQMKLVEAADEQADRTTRREGGPEGPPVP